MKLSTLRYFLAITKYNSFTKASERLFVTQPTLSRQIQELEDELGTRLFRRDYKSLQLTEDGKAFQKEAEEIVAHCDRVSKMFRKEDDIIKSEPVKLYIGYQKYFNTQRVYDIMHEIMLDNPGLDFMLSQSTPADLRKNLKSDKIDAAFMINTFLPQNTSDLRIVPFEHNHLQLVVSKRHPLSRRTSVSIAELKDENFILLNRPNAPAHIDFIIQQCMNNGFTPNVTHYVDDAVEGVEFAAAGRGVTFLHSGMFLESIANSYHVAALDIEDADMNLDFVAVCKKSNRNRILGELMDKLNIEN